MSNEPVLIRTHDRIAFKRCRRKWDFSSPLRQYLVALEDSAALWFGSGFHFALEDFNGYNRFGDPVTAFAAYTKAFPLKERPIDWEVMQELAEGMFLYYLNYWLPRRDDYRTLWIDGKPQVEVEFEIELPEVSKKVGYPVAYHGTWDRIVVNDRDELFIEDYKTASQFNTSKLQTDPQVTSYLWAGNRIFPQGVAGMIYTQFLKDIATGPKPLARGGFSQDKRQKTPHALYREALIDTYGMVPSSYVDFLDQLLDRESYEGDGFIRRDVVVRSEAAIANEYKKIQMEALDMLSDVALYPNPTRDCSFDCSFRTACICMDDDMEYQSLLKMMFKRKEEKEEWRKRIKYPSSQPQ